jgi:hypothetical protein
MGGGKMKLIALILGVMMVVPACTTFQHSENISVDHFGATGNYSDSRSGALYKLGLAGSGVGAGGNFGFGALGLAVDCSQSQSDPRYFARSIVMVDLSKKLRSVKVDECEGIREYEYVQPTDKSGGKSKSSSKLPSSFGHQPIE